MPQYIPNVAASATLIVFSETIADAATIDQGFALDESSSVSNPNFDISAQGLSNAPAQAPTFGDNSYRVSVVFFTDAARTIVPPTLVDATSLDGIRGTIVQTPRSFGGTGLGDTTFLDIATDGVSSSTSALQASAIAAFDAGVDSLSYEAIGAGPNPTALLPTAFPGPPMLSDDANTLPDPTQSGFVLEVDDFADFAGAIGSKIGRIIEIVEPDGFDDMNDMGDGMGDAGDMDVVPLPASFPLLLGGVALLGLFRRRSQRG